MSDIGENYKTCERIRDRLVAICEGRVFRCLECGAVVTDPEGVCRCGEMEDMDEWEQVALFDDDYIYDVEYRIGGDFEYRSVAVMVACGGPNIYVDTETRSVNLFWYSERATAWLPPEVVYEVDELYSETYESGRLRI